MFEQPSVRRAAPLRSIAVAGLLWAIGCEGEAPPEWIGACELVYTSFDVIDGDRRASIAAVETGSLCMVAPGSCGSRMSTDAAVACERVKVLASREGKCTLTVTSVSGEKVSAEIEILREVTDLKCRDGVGRIVPNVPFLRPDRPAVVIRFSVPDAGADGP